MKKMLTLGLLLSLGFSVQARDDANDLLVRKFWCPRGHFNWEQVQLVKKLCEIVQPSFGIETGFCTGRSALSVLAYAKPKKLVSIDINLDYMHPQGRQYRNILMNNFKNFTVVEGNTNHVLTPAFVEKNFEEGIDWVTVDGDHTYAGCMHDLQVTAPYLRENGIIVIDDYRASIPAVTKAVDDFYTQNPDFFLVHWHKDHKGCAIITRSEKIINEIANTLGLTIE